MSCSTAKQGRKIICFRPSTRVVSVCTHLDHACFLKAIARASHAHRFDSPKLGRLKVEAKGLECARAPPMSRRCLVCGGPYMGSRLCAVRGCPRNGSRQRDLRQRGLLGNMPTAAGAAPAYVRAQSSGALTGGGHSSASASEGGGGGVSSGYVALAPSPPVPRPTVAAPRPTGAVTVREAPDSAPVDRGAPPLDAGAVAHPVEGPPAASASSTAGGAPSGKAAPPRPLLSQGAGSEESDDSSGDASQEHSCVVCFVAPRQAAFLPCGHRCVCMRCALLIMGAGALPQCPLCRWGSHFNTSNLWIGGGLDQAPEWGVQAPEWDVFATRSSTSGCTRIAEGGGGGEAGGSAPPEAEAEVNLDQEVKEEMLAERDEVRRLAAELRGAEPSWYTGSRLGIYVASMILWGQGIANPPPTWSTSLSAG